MKRKAVVLTGAAAVVAFGVFVLLARSVKPRIPWDKLAPTHPPVPTGYPLSVLAARDYANLVQVFAGRPQVFTTAADASYQASRYGAGSEHTTWNVYDRLLGYQKSLNAGFLARMQATPRDWYYPRDAKSSTCGAGPGIPIYFGGLSNLQAVDAWGSPYCGFPGSPFGAVASAAQVVLPYIPGVGTASNAALQAAIALGEGKSLRDAALAAVRGALPAEAQLAFDLGVSVASGQDVDAAVKKALLRQIPNGEATYNLAIQTAKKAGIK